VKEVRDSLVSANLSLAVSTISSVDGSWLGAKLSSSILVDILDLCNLVLDYITTQ
jgi:hypothetical protein